MGWVRYCVWGFSVFVGVEGMGRMFVCVGVHVGVGGMGRLFVCVCGGLDRALFMCVC